MIRPRPTLICVIAALALPLLPASAQVCDGSGSFARGAFRLAASSAVNDDGRSFNLGLTVGGSDTFGEVGVGRTTFDAVKRSALVIDGEGGLEWALTRTRVASLCPMVLFSYAAGPKDVDIFGDGSVLRDFSETDIGGGVSFGVIASRSRDVEVIPTASIAWVSATVSIQDTGEPYARSSSTTFGALGFGVGFVFNHVVSVQPGVAIPLGLEGAPASFVLAASVTLHPRRP